MLWGRGWTQRDPEVCPPGCGVGDGDGGREGMGSRGAPRGRGVSCREARGNRHVGAAYGRE